jgi:arabinofuranan 3-O-arabinosyltransferase
MTVPDISIVIPTKNSERILQRCLDSIRSQDLRHVEIIVVDAHSEDSTKWVAERSADRFIEFKGGPSAARNKGFSEAKGRIFISMDSDMMMEPGLLKDVMDSLGRHGALVIPEVGHGKGFLSRCKSLEKRCYLGDSSVEAARAFTRKAYQSVGGFDASLHFGEDWDIHIRISERYSIGRTKAKLLHSTENLTLISNLRKAYSYGRSLPAFSRKHRRATRRWLSLSRFSRYLPVLAQDPLHAAGLIIIKSLEAVAALLGLLSSKLGR